MRKTLALLIATAMLLSLAACGDESAGTENNSSETTTTHTSQTTSETTATVTSLTTSVTTTIVTSPTTSVTTATGTSPTTSVTTATGTSSAPSSTTTTGKPSTELNDEQLVALFERYIDIVSFLGPFSSVSQLTGVQVFDNLSSSVKPLSKTTKTFTDEYGYEYGYETTSVFSVVDLNNAAKKRYGRTFDFSNIADLNGKPSNPGVEIEYAYDAATDTITTVVTVQGAMGGPPEKVWEYLSYTRKGNEFTVSAKKYVLDPENWDMVDTGIVKTFNVKYENDNYIIVSNDLD